MQISIDAMLPALEKDALSEDNNIRSRAAAASLLLKLTAVDPVAVPQIDCDDLPKACSRMRPQYKVLREWSRRGHILAPAIWRGRAQFCGRACTEAVVLSQLLRRGLRGEQLADIMRRVLRTPADTLTALAIEPDGVSKLYDATAVGV